MLVLAEIKIFFVVAEMGLCFGFTLFQSLLLTNLAERL